MKDLLDIINLKLEWVLTAIILPIIAWFSYGRKKTKVDLEEKNVNVSAISTDVLLKNFNLHLKMIEDIEKRYENELKQRDLIIERLEKKIVKLEETLKKYIKNN